MKKKIISFALVVVLIGTSCGQVFATSTNRTNQRIKNLMTYNTSKDEGSFEKMPEITDEEFNAALEQAIKMEVEKVKNKEEAELLEKEMRMYLQDIDGSVQSQNILGDLIDDIKGKIPNIKMKNKSVAAAINAIINATLIATGAGTIGVALKKYGAKELAKIFTRTLKSKVLGKALIALGISTPVIVDYIMYIADPAAKIAEFIDSKDDDPNNGYFDVIWSKH